MASYIRHTKLRWIYEPRFIILAVITNLFFVVNSHAQYFGRNKPGYKTFEFDVLQTPHFEIYHYLRNDSLINALSQWSEKWYQAHQKVFRDTFDIKNPIIFYNTHSDFQQTNTISSLIGTGTGGVTEGLKNRVIMPVAPSLAQTDHTLGHELVHAFQYNMLLDPDTSKHYSINEIPLWMIEGMAEYLSLGSIDPNTSMWMRDALLNDDFPTIKQLSTDSKYFPYRFGHALMAMIGKTWGDTILLPLLEKTALYGFEKAVDSVFGYNTDNLSGIWKSATDLYYKKYLKSETDNLAGNQIISEKDGGNVNISPSISPDGKYLAFFSEKNLFTLDLFLADATTGDIIKKLSSIVKNDEIDDFSFIESSGTWSPDGRQFAFVIFSKGRNKLAVLDIEKSKIIREYDIPGVSSFYNPAWSPNGKKIVMTGIVNGISDLYLFHPGSGRVERLTHDFESNLHPSWSSDGNYIVFSREIINELTNKKKYSFNLAILDINSKKVEKIDILKDAYNMNPLFSPDDRYIYFLSDADGFRNLYKYEPESKKLFRLTAYMTGISGITPYSPAISIAKNKDLIVYNYYFDSKYQILAASDSQFESVEVDKHQTDFRAGTLPPLEHYSVNLVDSTIYNLQELQTLPPDSIKEVPYKSKFKLDYISNNASIGVSSGIYRNNLEGSVNMIFSDMVGNNQLYSSLALNGEIYDFGGQAAYINQKGRIKWGAALSHVPYRYGNMFVTTDSINYNDNKIEVTNLVVDYIRMFEDNISFYASYPLSQTRRFEATLSSSWYYYRIDRYNNYYLPGGYPLGGTKEKLDAPEGDNYQQISLAYVADNSYFGMTSPMNGHRSRYQVEKYFGDANIFTTLIDYRHYFFIKPLGLAFRLYNYGMYGSDAEDGVIPPLYIGYPTLLRGYERLSRGNKGSFDENTFNISLLSGSKIALANAEIRLPLTGPERLALIKSKWLLTDLNMFFDAGLAWNSDSKITLDPESVSNMDNNVRYPLLSTGVSIRINLLGYVVIEPYYAFPLQNGGFSNGVFGLNFVPGW